MSLARGALLLLLAVQWPRDQKIPPVRYPDLPQPLLTLDQVGDSLEFYLEEH